MLIGAVKAFGIVFVYLGCVMPLIWRWYDRVERDGR